MPRRNALRPLALAMAGAWLLVASSCGLGSSDDDQVTVFAAASLGDAFEAMAERFEADNPGVDVRLSIAGSSTLREQILEGAPASIFASASPETMSQVADADLLSGEAIIFARNTLVLAVAKDSEGLGIDGLSDLARAELSIGLCAEQVPCGRYATEVLDLAGVNASVDTREPDVRALLSKLADGELDAGLVYASDVAASDTVEAVAALDGADITYLLGVVAEHQSVEADAFAAFVLSLEGQAILFEHGLLPA